MPVKSNYKMNLQHITTKLPNLLIVLKTVFFALYLYQMLWHKHG